MLLLYHSGHYRKPSGREEILVVQCLSSRITPNTNFNQHICAALIPQICARMTDDAASAPYRKANGSGSVVKAAVRATGYLIPIKLSIAHWRWAEGHSGTGTHHRPGGLRVGDFCIPHRCLLLERRVRYGDGQFGRATERSGDWSACIWRFGAGLSVVDLL